MNKYRQISSAYWLSHWQQATHSGTDKTDAFSRKLVRYLKKELDPITGKAILDVGAGTGQVDILLTQAGAKLTLLDISDNSIAFCRNTFQNFSLEATFIVLDMFEIATEQVLKEQFDVVFSSGVIEHYSEQEQKSILANMGYCCKPGGMVINFAPSYRGSIYRHTKEMLEKSGQWKFGAEFPVKTLRHCVSSSLSIKREYNIMFLEQFSLAPLHGLRKILYYFLRLLLARQLDPFYAQLFGGYLLVSVFEKKVAGRAEIANASTA
ncbi:MAG: class I SAM-dependent methyltransferase [Anaerolineae bacterium]|nr:class I SAM-dependent methyltransferase [Anaerolineae bacterium]